MNPILTVKNVTFKYYHTNVLDDLSFTLYEGDFLGIIGANGTGKSTLIKLILGLLPCSSGTITSNNHDSIGYVSQKANSFNSDFPATVREVIMANLYSQIGLFKCPTKKHKEIFDAVVKEVGIEGLENRRIGNLSGGQQQKVFLARTLITRPSLLLLDEPTVGVDAPSVRTITEMISSLNKNGMTIIMTNHDTHSLLALSNKLLVLSEDGSASFYDKSAMSEYKLRQLCSGLEGHSHA